MKNSTFTNSVFTEDYNYSIPHRKGKIMDFINYDNCGPAASINSCAEDMLKWAQFWINKGIANSKRLLTVESYYTITQSYMGLKAGKAEKAETLSRHHASWFAACL